MATVNLGRIKPVWKNEWTASTSYVADDIVRSGASSYICVNAHTSGATFAVGSDWELMAAGGVDGTTVGTGTTGQVLQTDSAGTGVEWADASGGGKILQVVQTVYGGYGSVASSSWTPTGMYSQITPTSATSKILVMVNGGGFEPNSASGGVYAKVYTNAPQGNYSGSYVGMDGASMSFNHYSEGACPASIAYLHEPNSTNTIGYQMYVYEDNGNTVYINYYGSADMTMTLMEIAA
jgi:hypothetical protein